MDQVPYQVRERITTASRRAAAGRCWMVKSIRADCACIPEEDDAETDSSGSRYNNNNSRFYKWDSFSSDEAAAEELTVNRVKWNLLWRRAVFLITRGNFASVSAAWRHALRKPAAPPLLLLLLLLLFFLQPLVPWRLASVQQLVKPSPAPAPFLSLGNFENFINMLMT